MFSLSPNPVAGNTIGLYLDHIDPYRIETQRRTIKQDDNPPNKKYFKPADVDDSEFLYKVAKIYNPKLCNSILKYTEMKSKLEINKEEPKILNKTIIE
jgi:hypothetical protein